MFLRKSDAEYFAKKWTGMKQAEGVFKSTQNFFTENAVKNSKSILMLNNDLFKYRQIIGILSTVPELKTESLRPFYKYINENNDFYSEKADKEKRKREKEELTSFIIPIRKSVNYTSWFLRYLIDNNLLNNFRIAYFKTLEDRSAFLQQHNIASVKEFKLRMKQATGEDKKRLTAIYKEAKKNFIFKEPSVFYDNYCTKKLNAFLQYDFEHDGKTITVQVTISPDFLLKWVLSHLLYKKGEQVKNDLISYLKTYYYKCIENDFSQGIKGLNINKIFPSSLIDTVENTNEMQSIEKVERIVDCRFNELQKFYNDNQNRRASWKFASKRKIDIILDYIHMLYLDKAYDEHKLTDIARIRHEALNDMEYLDTFEEIRFYGKYKDTDEFKKFFFEEKKIYFQPILKAIKQVDSLENLFNFAIEGYLNYLKNIKDNIIEANIDKYYKVFKITGKSLRDKIGEHAKMFAVNHCIPHELIRFGNIEDYKKWKEGVKNKEWISDFSFIRCELEKRGGFSNTDYLMKEIMSVLLKKKMLPMKENGKIKGNRLMYNNLVKSKTNELMLWEIAKCYWKKATGAEFERKFKTLDLNQTDKINTAYKKVNPYYTLFQEEMEVKLQKNEKGKEKENPVYIIKVKAKKFDDEYQYYEQEHIIDYLENYKPPKGLDGNWHFEELNKNIKDELARYLDDIYLVMTAEKFIIQNNFDDYAALLKAEENKLPEYYMAFDGKNISKKKRHYAKFYTIN